MLSYFYSGNNYSHQLDDNDVFYLLFLKQIKEKKKKNERAFIKIVFRQLHLLQFVLPKCQMLIKRLKISQKHNMFILNM